MAVPTTSIAESRARIVGMIGQGFDDQLFFPDQGIDNQAEAFLGGSDDDHEAGFFYGQIGDGMNMVEPIQAHEGKKLIAEAQNFALVDDVNFALVDARDFHDG
jgi:hypothetical protein